MYDLNNYFKLDENNLNKIIDVYINKMTKNQMNIHDEIEIYARCCPNKKKDWKTFSTFRRTKEKNGRDTPVR